MWQYYIAVGIVVATILFVALAQSKKEVATKAASLPKPAREERDEAEPSTLIKMHAMSGYAFLIVRGVVLDVLQLLLAPLSWRRASPAAGAAAPAAATMGWRVGPNIWTGWVVFYTRRLYNRIEDCWNRPITGEASSTIDVCVRRRAGRGDAAPLVCTGETQKCLNLGSYNYLGFGGVEPLVTPQVVEALREYGVSSCSSRMECGDTPVHHELEATVAEFLDKPAALIVGMGFATNSTLIPVLVDPCGNGKGVLIVSDALNHSSIVEGVRGSGARVQPFVHNNMEHLESVLWRATESGQPDGTPWRKIIIVVEGIYSMEGQFCSLRTIVQLKKRYRAYLYLDEAHSIGAVGPRGRGATDHLGVPTSEVDVMMGTFTKSFGSIGGYIAGSRDLIDALRRHSAASLYAPAMSVPAVAQALGAFRIIMGTDGRSGDLGVRKIRQLRENSNTFRKGLQEIGCRVLGDLDSPVIPIMLYHPEKISAFSRACLERNLATVVVGYPATPLLLSRARFCIAASHTPEMMEHALAQIKAAAEEVGVRYDRSAADAARREGRSLDEAAEARKQELLHAPMEALPATTWVPEPLVPPTNWDATPPAEAFAEARAAAALPPPPLELRRTDFVRLAVDAAPRAAAEAALLKYGCGTCGPRGFYGTLDVHLELEAALATFLGTEQSIVYSFGIATISSVVPAFVRKGDLLFVDGGVHFTTAVGVRLARGALRSFAHNDLNALEEQLAAQDKLDSRVGSSKRPRRFVLVEGLYANSGDLADLPALLALRQKYGFYLMVDDTLGFGSLGATGRGTAEAQGVEPRMIDVLVGSLEHSLGSVGGFCAGSAPIVSHQRLSGAGYCFSASLPAYATVAALEALRVLQREPQRLARVGAASAAQHEALRGALARLPASHHVEVLSDPRSPLAHVRINPAVASALSPQRRETALRRAAERTREVAGAAVQLVRHSALAHIQAQRPPSLRLAAHSDVDVPRLAEAAAVLVESLAAELARDSPAIEAAAALKAHAAIKAADKELVVGAEKAADKELAAGKEGKEHAAAAAPRTPIKGAKGGKGGGGGGVGEEEVKGPAPPVTTPLLVGFELLRRVIRHYIKHQMEWHVISLMPLIDRMRSSRSATLKWLFASGELLGSEAFYFFVIPLLSWSPSVDLKVPTFVAFFTVNLYVGNWLKNLFALRRPLGGTRDAQTNDFGWPSMYAINAVGLPFFAMRYWYGGFGSGTPFSEQNPWVTFFSYISSFVWVVVVCGARLYSGASSPADVQGGMLVGGVLVRVWLPVCDVVNEWIVGHDSRLFGLPQWAALFLISATLLLLHPITPKDPRSWTALGYSVKAIAFGNSFILGSNTCAIRGCAHTALTLDGTPLSLVSVLLLMQRNLIGFGALAALWYLSCCVAGAVERRLRKQLPLWPCAPMLLRNVACFATMGVSTSLGVPLLFNSLGL